MSQKEKPSRSFLNTTFYLIVSVWFISRRRLTRCAFLKQQQQPSLFSPQHLVPPPFPFFLFHLLSHSLTLSFSLSLFCCKIGQGNLQGGPPWGIVWYLTTATVTFTNFICAEFMSDSYSEICREGSKGGRSLSTVYTVVLSELFTTRPVTCALLFCL